MSARPPRKGTRSPMPSTAKALRSTSRQMTAQSFQDAFDRIVTNAGQVIKGKESALRLVLTAMLADGHCLLEDMPGTGKTMMARALSTSIEAVASRIQCTP